MRPTGASDWTAFASSQLCFALIDVYDHQLVINGIGVNGRPFDQGVVAADITQLSPPVMMQ